ncbi:sulfatase-like hydrolase/transferase [Cytophagaceae bacterium ABcell3]|nr:sulfatase-like hydrolase/transferase [Cytophagaceae bacterium ABcell3]
MKYQLAHIWTLLRRLGIALLCFSILRVLFYVFNHSYFPDANFWVFILGLRFDFSAVAYLFSPFILLHLLPFKFTDAKSYQKVLKHTFLGINALCIVLNLADIIYFRFIFRRTTADVFHFFTDSGEGWTMMPRFLYDYWYLTIFFGALLILSNVLYSRTITPRYPVSYPSTTFYSLKTFALLLAIPMVIMFGRGGLQNRPIQIIDASLFSKANLVPLIVNTPFSVMNTVGQPSSIPTVSMEEQEALKHFNFHKEIKPFNTDNQGKNVVLIILESFGSEYIGYFNEGKGYTPFLDSLIGQSIVFENSYANGKRSIDAMPSIIAGLPSMMNDPYVYSRYASNKLKTLPNLLKAHGYHSAFFHGGKNGTMGFDSFCRLAGFDDYFGKNEYTGAKEDFDGHWGIFDGPYLKYSAETMGTLPEPFFSTIFTLSSHHPYLIPEEYQDKFPKGTLEIHESIGYADHALKEFFTIASQKPWFKNTVFVITADHTAQAEKDYYKSGLGMFSVPIFIYDPQQEENYSIYRTMQHIDIMPSVLSYLGFSTSGNFFGNNIFNDDLPQNMPVLAYNFGTFIYEKDGYGLEYNGEKVTSFNVSNTKGNTDKSYLDEKKSNLETGLKAYLKIYHSALNQNLLGE